MAAAAAATTTPFRFRPARLRFPAQHPFFEEGDVQRHLQLQELLRGGGGGGAEGPRSPPPSGSGSGSASPELCCGVPGCRQPCGGGGGGSSLRSYEHHYDALHRDVCAACGRAFPSAHLLSLHLLERHDALFLLAAQRQDAYQCLVESCTEKFKNCKDREDHLVQVHRYPSDFRFDNKPLEAQSSCTEPRRPPAREGAAPMDVSMEAASEPLHGDAMETGCCTENTWMEGTCQPAARESSVVLPTCHRWRYRARIPPTICFGQGAPRGFRGWNENP